MFYSIKRKNNTYFSLLKNFMPSTGLLCPYATIENHSLFLYSRLDYVQSGFFSFEQVLPEPFKIFLLFQLCRFAVSVITQVKGRKSPRLCVAKGGEKMNDPYERRVQNQFGGFCTRVLKNEAARIHNEYARQRDREKSLGDLTACELLEIATVDKHFDGEHVFEVQGKPVVVNGDLLAEAIAKLSEDKRDIILLSYFLGMSDREISEYMNMVRQTVSRWRTKTLKVLRKYLKKEGFEWPKI